ncbi:MAG: HAMP domain-containing histidine kinase [Candidatus Melainabacteria bacterium]|jgi:signal transduction histidine kinase|nr:HAMP domain-containing histidine kinase [Candidatus Melainabacteria bacterium]
MKLTLRPTIFSNGLLLISIPLFFELAFAGTLFYLQLDYESKLQQQIHANKVVARTNEMWLAVMDLTTSIFATKVFPDKQLHCRWPINKIDHEYEALVKLIEHEPSHLPTLHRMRDRAMSVLASSRSFEDPELSGGIAGLRGNLQKFQRLKFGISSLGDEMVRFRAPFLQRTEKADAEMREARTKIAFVTISGVGASIVLAGLLFSLFMRNIYSGIRRLMENTILFAVNKPLIPAPDRDDELSQLEKTFHIMTKTVAETAEEQARLEQLKQEFFHMVTHDMRTPISSIILSTESLSSGLAGEISPEALPTVERVEKNANMLMNLITDLLDLETAESQGVKLLIEDFDIKELLEEVAQLVETQAARANVAVKIESDSLPVHADRMRILRVVTNLVTNAVKFSPKNSTVTLRAQQGENRLAVEVIDEGRGIPADHIQAVFNRFHQVEKDDSRKKRGSGLGLSIAKVFVEAHRGRILVESEPGKGSRFWFWIPNKIDKIVENEPALPVKEEEKELPENFQKPA